MKALLSLALLFSLSASAEDCLRYIGTCQYYLCREKEHACGTKGYYLGFAYKYCLNAESKLNHHLSEEGKIWSKNVSQCLRDSVERIPYDDNCTDAKQTAFREHGDCYVDTGFCQLSHKDQLHVAWFVKKEIRRPIVLKQGFSILSECR